MKIIADENIPYAEQLFGLLGEVELKPGRNLAHRDLEGANILLTRSVTKVNKTLLKGHDIEFVGTCTIGTDHLDKTYLDDVGIQYRSAPGCNANGVVQYVITAIAKLGRLNTQNRVGIIGCGNVGGRVYKTLKALGFECVCVDPHLSIEQIQDLADFSALYGCDIICMHTPRIRGGDHPTEGLIHREVLNKLKSHCLLINAGRGECIDNNALLSYLRSRDDLDVVLDVWANEPHMNAELFSMVDIGTPHIAGYSFEGRVGGSTMIFEALALHLGKSPEWVAEKIEAVREQIFGSRETLEGKTILELIERSYDIEADHMDLAEALEALPTSFDALRKNYHKRREFSHYYSDDVLEDAGQFLQDPAQVLGFSK